MDTQTTAHMRKFYRQYQNICQRATVVLKWQNRHFGRYVTTRFFYPSLVCYQSFINVAFFFNPFQCCENGHVSPLVVTNLRLALSWTRFADAMGPALKSREGEKLRYDLERLPKEWVRHSPTPSRKNVGSRPSRKRDGRFQITKSKLSQSKKKKD